MADENPQSDIVHDRGKTKTLMRFGIGIGLSILSVIFQFYAYKFLWPPPSAMNGPMGMLAYEIQSCIALIAVAIISFGIFILMLIMGVKWYSGQGLAILNFIAAIMASAV